MTHKEALKMALEALQEPLGFTGSREIDAKLKEAIITIKEALAQPEQLEGLQLIHKADIDLAKKRATEAQPEQEPQPPYEFERYVAGSLRAQGVMVERATTLADAMRIAAKICPPANPPSAPTVLVYTTPPQRPSRSDIKPLTDGQFKKIKASLSRQEGWDGDGWDLALKEAIEAAHGIKE